MAMASEQSINRLADPPLSPASRLLQLIGESSRSCAAPGHGPEFFHVVQPLD